MPLRIGIDARELLGDTTGVGRYLGELLRHWTARADARQRIFLLYAPERLLLHLPAAASEQRIVGRGRGTWWEQTSLRQAVAADRPDVFFAPAYTAPIGLRMPFAVTIHDISFIARPEWFRPRERFRRRWLTRYAAAQAAVIFTDSAFSRSELERHVGVDADRIRVVPPGVVSRTPGGASPAGQREALVLYVGSVFNRRRLPDLIEAFARGTRELPQARLVIVGHNRTFPHQDLDAIAVAHGVADRTELLSYVPDDILDALYRRASVFAFLSEYEGFGMTPLEALSAGVPPVVLDTPVAREVLGDAALFVTKGDIEGTAAALRRLLVDPSSSVPLLGKAGDVLARYSWRAAADTILQHLEGIAAR